MTTAAVSRAKSPKIDKTAFHPYFYVKDLVSWLGSALFFFFLVYFYSNLLAHPDNYIPANPVSTPAHIVPEWYSLWIYAILQVGIVEGH